jgi:gluconolactonase
VSCEHGGRRVTRTEYDGSSTVLLDEWDGQPLNSPNDVITKSDGSVWFTDPSFGILGRYEGHRAEPALGSNVYRVDPSTSDVAVVVDDVAGPNGLCFSPDERVLYLVDSRAMPRRQILAFDVAEDGRMLSNKRVHIEAGEDGAPDGMRCDTDGNLWCGWGDGRRLVRCGDGVRAGRDADRVDRVARALCERRLW